MKILAIDTSGSYCSVAVGGDVLRPVLVEDDTALSHSARLLAMIESALSEAGHGMDGLDAVAVTIGPGSFTGLRIGVAVAQGLAYGQRVPVVTASSLQQVAAQVHVEEQGGVVLVSLDARMAEVYAGWYEIDSLQPRCLGREHVIAANRLLETVPEACTFEDGKLALEQGRKAAGLLLAGGGFSAYDDVPQQLLQADAPGLSSCTLEQRCALRPNAQTLLRLAQHKLVDGDVCHPAALKPVYLRDKVTG